MNSFYGGVSNTEPGSPSVAVFTSSARTATPTPVDVQRGAHRGVHLVIDVTAVTSTPSVVPKIQGLDPLSGKYYDLLVGVALTATGTNVLKVCPGIAATANATAADGLPGVFRVVMTHGNANSITYTVAANMIA